MAVSVETPQNTVGDLWCGKHKGYLCTETIYLVLNNARNDFPSGLRLFFKKVLFASFFCPFCQVVGLLLM